MKDYTIAASQGKQNNPKRVAHFYIWALAFYILIVPLDAIKLFESFSFMRVLILIPMLCALPQVKSQGLKMTKSGGLLFLFLCIIVFSVLYSVDISISKGAALSISLNAGVVLILSLFQIGKDEMSILKRAFLMSSWFAAFLMIVTSITTISTTGRISISNGSTTQDANYVCGYLLYAVAFYTNEVFKGNGRLRNTAILFFFAMMVFMTGSRGGLLAFLFCAVVTFLSCAAKGKNKIQATLVLMILAVLFIVISPYLIQYLPETVAERFSVAAVIKDKGTGRTVLWRNILDAFNMAPFIRKIFGYGIGTSVHFTWTHLLAHNMWLEYLIGTGLIGTLFALLFYFRLSRICWKKDEMVILGTLMGYMMMSMSLSIMAYKPIWNVALLILLLERVKEYGTME